MKLEFRLLVIDDKPDSVDNAVGILKDHLDARGFTLRRDNAPDLTKAGLKALARRSGKDFDLVAIDYHLDQPASDGGVAAAEMRRQLQYTDIVFYSSNTADNTLLQVLAELGVSGVFVAARDTLGDALVGLADTIVGKAIDLNHMRGIAMAQVAEMDVLMEHALERAFSCPNQQLEDAGAKTLRRVCDKAEEAFEKLKKLADDGNILDVLTDNTLFSSNQKYMAMNRAMKCVAKKPDDCMSQIKDYASDVIGNRNILAHAKEETSSDGSVTLRAIKRGKEPVTITEDWMVEFRQKLRIHHQALSTICAALEAHVDNLTGGKTP